MISIVATAYATFCFSEFFQLHTFAKSISNEYEQVLNGRNSLEHHQTENSLTVASKSDVNDGQDRQQQDYSKEAESTFNISNDQEQIKTVQSREQETMSSVRKGEEQGKARHISG